MPLSYLENERSMKPSTILELYLLISIVLDLPQLRTLHLLHESTIAVIFMAVLLLKFLLLLLELRSKRSYLLPEYQSTSPEATSGIISRSFMWWLKELFIKGTNSYIEVSDLPELDDHLSADYLGKRMIRIWEKRSRPEGRFSFVITLWHCFIAQFAHVFVPRLCLIGFTFAQPFLISRVLGLLLEPESETSRYEGYGLVLATAMIYLGIAVGKKNLEN
jgi:hypothetical protein